MFSLRIYLLALFTTIWIAPTAHAYNIEIMNAMGQPIQVNIEGFGNPDRTFFNGVQATEPGPTVEELNSKTIVIHNAQALQGLQTINPYEVVTYRMQWFQIGVCFDFTAGIKIGRENEAVFAQNIKIVPDAYSTAVQRAMGDFSASVQEIGSAIKGASPDPYAQAIGAGGQGLGAAISGASKLWAASTCKDVQLQVIEDENGMLHVLTRSVH